MQNENRVALAGNILTKNTYIFNDLCCFFSYCTCYKTYIIIPRTYGSKTLKPRSYFPFTKVLHSLVQNFSKMVQGNSASVSPRVLGKGKDSWAQIPPYCIRIWGGKGSYIKIIWVLKKINYIFHFLPHPSDPACYPLLSETREHVSSYKCKCKHFQ